MTQDRLSLKWGINRVRYSKSIAGRGLTEDKDAQEGHCRPWEMETIERLARVQELVQTKHKAQELYLEGKDAEAAVLEEKAAELEKRLKEEDVICYRGQGTL